MKLKLKTFSDWLKTTPTSNHGFNPHQVARETAEHILEAATEMSFLRCTEEDRVVERLIHLCDLEDYIKGEVTK